MAKKYQPLQNIKPLHTCYIFNRMVKQPAAPPPPTHLVAIKSPPAPAAARAAASSFYNIIIYLPLISVCRPHSVLADPSLFFRPSKRPERSPPYVNHTLWSTLRVDCTSPMEENPTSCSGW